MLYRYKELINEKYKSDNKLKEALIKREIYKTNYSLYSDKENVSELELIAKKFDKLIFNSDSAFFYLGLTDNIPKKYYLASKKKSKKILDNKVCQTFMEDKYFNIGETYIYYNNVKLHIYDKERMLIELIRHKNKISYDMYKEIIISYRNIIDKLDLLKLQNYISYFTNSEKILKTIQEEVL